MHLVTARTFWLQRHLNPRSFALSTPYSQKFPNLAQEEPPPTCHRHKVLLAPALHYFADGALAHEVVDGQGSSKARVARQRGGISTAPHAHELCIVAGHAHRLSHAPAVKQAQRDISL